ncbi:MAG: DUF1376 domain-containing protein [Pseudomonadota bacterium]
MSRRPYMQLFVSDYLGDTMHLSTEQHGAYLLLLMSMWNAGGELPDDDRKLAHITRLSVKKWKAHRPDMKALFDVGDGVWQSARMTKELQKVESQSQSRSSAGAKGARAKALKTNKPDKANAQAGLKHTRYQIPDSSSLCSEPHGRAREPGLFGEAPPKKIEPSPQQLTAWFNRFWDDWPNKVGRKAAVDAFGKAIKRGASAENIIAGVGRYKRDKPPDRQWLNPATFLNQERWNDEPSSQPTQPTARQSSNPVQSGLGSAIERLGGSARFSAPSADAGRIIDAEPNAGSVQRLTVSGNGRTGG